MELKTWLELNSKLVEVTDQASPYPNTDAIMQEVVGVMRTDFAYPSGFCPPSSNPIMRKSSNTTTCSVFYKTPGQCVSELSRS